MADNYDSGESSSPETENEVKDDDKKLLEEAKSRFKILEDAEHETRALALEDITFAAGEQWDAEALAERRAERRPCLTINRLPQHIRAITNDQRQNRPSIKVHPVDDKADVETAKILSGLIRHIEYNSNADAAYDTAFEGAVRGGFGYFRILTKYVSPLSFDQEIIIGRIKNPFAVGLDPFHKEPDGSDANWGFVWERISKDDYKRNYPNSKLAQDGEWEITGSTAPHWMGSNSAVVAEYFYKEYQSRTLCLLDSGEVVFKEELDQVLEIKAAQGAPAQVLKERDTQIPVVKWCKLNGCEILEKTDWPGQYIPIIPVYGEELDIDGKRILKGIVRDAKDPQRMLNFWKSAETEAIALAPKAPWIVEEGQIQGYEQEWANANRKNYPFLKYKAKSKDGTPLPPPQRQGIEPAVQAITQAAMLAADDLKSTTGQYDAALGARSNETSGVAIQRRTNQAQTSNYHFVDNLTRSIRHAGRILIDVIPHIYDSARAERIIGEEGDHDVVRLNELFEHKGKQVTYDLSKGKYDATVDVGPSYASKRQEAVASMLEFARAVPNVAAITGDLIAKAQDWPGAQEFADRIKKTLPPGLADDPKKQPIPPEAQAQMQQMQAQMQQMGQMLDEAQAQLGEAQEAIRTKLIEIQSKERIEMKKLEVQLEIKRAEIDALDARKLLDAEIASIEQRLRSQELAAPMFEEEQVPPPVDAGGPPAEGVPPEEIDPTGGESPGLPIEGMNDDDPSSFQ